ncbi:MAG TPA: ATP-binding protein [Trueperaceae bacterium]
MTRPFGRFGALALLGSLLLVLLVGLLDFLTGADLSFSLFYLLPIALATRQLGRFWGLALSVVSALAWFWADAAAGLHPLGPLPFWNALVRLTFFVICVLFLSGLAERRRLELERELADRAALEQRRIGQELHDTVMQQLVGTRMLAGALQRRLQGAAPGAAEAAELARELDEASSQLRRLMSGLAAVRVGAGELVPAVERVVQNFRQWYGLPVRLESVPEVVVRDDQTAHHLVLLVQEALMNALRHARASCVVVRLEAGPQELLLEVVDDGVGLPENSGRLGGMGLQSMRQRASLIDASLWVGRGEPRGTVVSCSLRNYAPKGLEGEAGGL